MVTKNRTRNLTKKKEPIWTLFSWLGWRDSNPRMPGPKPGALPLGDTLVRYVVSTEVLYRTRGKSSRVS